MNEKLLLSEYDYELEKKYIAQEPIKNRDESKLLIYNKGKIEHKKFHDIINYLKKDDVLVINTTKVKASKLIGKKETGSPAEIILLEQIQDKTYKCLIDSRKPQINGKIFIEEEKEEIFCIVKNKEDNIYTIEFNKNIEPYIKEKGKVPLPAYMNKDNKIKNERYQTIYSKKEGSFAAPTAGLHFTKELLEKIKNKGIKIAEVNLEVGLGTFLPILKENIKEHKMHTETFEITKENADIINNRKGRLFVVGTTSLRTLESSTENGKVIAQKKETNIFIYPDYKFKNKIDGLITNFHLPKSSLLLLVSAYLGKENIFKIYEEAKKNNYKFYSFGDSSLLIK